MHCFFTNDIQKDQALIHGEDVRHIGKVLRLKSGDTVHLFDGNGHECDAKIASVSNDAVVCKTDPWRPSASEPETSVTLFQCIPKAGKMETIIQKCVELGAVSFVPVQSERCVAVWKPPYENKTERLQRISEEAAKQSRRGRIPNVQAPQTLDRLAFDGFDYVLAAYENETAVSLKTALKTVKRGSSIAIVIGPEGGFSEHEIALLREKGAVSVSLGPRILRTETAGMAMLAQILYEVET